MSEPTWMQKSGATPGKLALVGCLAVGLGFVLWNQNSGRADQSATLKSPPQSLPPQQAEATNNVLVEKTEVSKQTNELPFREWPQMPLESVVKNDPFAKPSWYLAATTEAPRVRVQTDRQTKAIAEQLKSEETKIVLISDGNRIATIGDETYRVGDSIAGFRIAEINRDGVVVTDNDR